MHDIISAYSLQGFELRIIMCPLPISIALCNAHMSNMWLAHMSNNGK